MKLLAIVGPTASGKSALGLELAQRLGGEIICADSRTIYRGMDIGTAKPSAIDQRLVPHHLLDIVEPNQSFSAAEFKAKALEAIDQIRDRGRLPILVGGSGLYIYAVIYDYQFPAGARTEQRHKLEQQSLEDLAERLLAIDPEASGEIDLRNKRRVIRAIETAGQPRTKAELINGTRLIGLNPGPDQLARRITARTDQMLRAGLQEEVEALVGRYGSDTEALRSPGYAEVVDAIVGRGQDGQLRDLINLHTVQLAKRQLTWFKRNPNIEWFTDIPAAERAIIG